MAPRHMNADDARAHSLGCARAVVLFGPPLLLLEAVAVYLTLR